MRPPRFRLRTLLVAVAVVGVVLGVWIALRRRSESFRELAGRHAFSAAIHRGHVIIQSRSNVSGVRLASAGLSSPGRRSTAAEITRATERYEYHYRLMCKYERAAARPWLPVPPDPPEPR